MADQLRALRGRSAGLQATLLAEEEASLTLAMHVALPIVERMTRNALQAEGAAGQAFGDALAARKDELATLISADVGRPRKIPGPTAD